MNLTNIVLMNESILDPRSTASNDTTAHYPYEPISHKPEFFQSRLKSSSNAYPTSESTSDGTNHKLGLFLESIGSKKPKGSSA